MLDLLTPVLAGSKCSFREVLFAMRAQCFFHIVFTMGQQQTQVQCGPHAMAAPYMPHFAKEVARLAVEKFSEGFLNDAARKSETSRPFIPDLVAVQAATGNSVGDVLIECMTEALEYFLFVCY